MSLPPLNEQSLMYRFAEIAGKEIAFVDNDFVSGDAATKELFALLVSSGFNFRIVPTGADIDNSFDPARANVHLHEGTDGKWRIGQQITLG